MGDPVAVRLVERVGDLHGDFQRLVQRERSLFESGRERLPVEVRHDDEMGAAGFTDVVDAADVRMVERRDRPRFPFEPLPQIGIAGDVWLQHLDRDAAIEPRVARFVDLAHSASPEGGEDLIRTETGSGGKGHRM